MRHKWQNHNGPHGAHSSIQPAPLYLHVGGALHGTTGTEVAADYTLTGKRIRGMRELLHSSFTQVEGWELIHGETILYLEEEAHILTASEGKTNGL